MINAEGEGGNSLIKLPRSGENSSAGENSLPQRDNSPALKGTPSINRGGVRYSLYELQGEWSYSAARGRDRGWGGGYSEAATISLKVLPAKVLPSPQPLKGVLVAVYIPLQSGSDSSF